MLGRIVLVVAAAIAVLVFAQRQDVVHKWGVAGSCEGVRAPAAGAVRGGASEGPEVFALTRGEC